MKISKILLIIVLFIAFFEIGLFSSYTIVTSEVPNVQDLIDMQINTVTSVFSSDNVGSVLMQQPTEINITNKNDLSEVLTNKSEVDGVNVDNMTITTTQDPNEESNITVNITTYGYSAPSSSAGQIVLSQNPDYKIIASANATSSSEGIKVNLSTVNIDSILKVYNNGSSDVDSINAQLANNSSNSSSSSSSSNYNSGSSSSSSSSYNSGSSSSSSSNYDSGSSDPNSGSSVSNYLLAYLKFI